MATKNLASERVRVGLTQEQMCEKLGGIAVSTLCRYETDVNTAPVSILCKVADICDCSVDYLLGRKAERTA